MTMYYPLTTQHTRPNTPRRDRYSARGRACRALRFDRRASAGAPVRCEEFPESADEVGAGAQKSARETPATGSQAAGKPSDPPNPLLRFRVADDRAGRHATPNPGRRTRPRGRPRPRRGPTGRSPRCLRAPFPCTRTSRRCWREVSTMPRPASPARSRTQRYGAPGSGTVDGLRRHSRASGSADEDGREERAWGRANKISLLCLKLMRVSRKIYAIL